MRLDDQVEDAANPPRQDNAAMTPPRGAFHVRWFATTTCLAPPPCATSTMRASWRSWFGATRTAWVTFEAFEFVFWIQVSADELRIQQILNCLFPSRNLRVRNGCDFHLFFVDRRVGLSHW